ncbi:MAG: DegT/DnrJ/EryC1/StrS aminotransferase family protein [Hyphomonadaceae bacterium]|nr:DegT/DnrJ/EryC1/StrS aminotransferase family protein [Hyphomonadaceae bacterium]
MRARFASLSGVGYRDYPVAPGGLPVTDAKADVVISLPMHPDLTEEDQDRVIDAIRAWKR